MAVKCRTGILACDLRKSIISLRLVILILGKHRPEAYATTGKTQAGGLCYYWETIK